MTAPGGDPVTDKGPISASIVTAGGSGYAKLGRVAPTLTVSGGSGTGATFTPTLSTSQDACDLDLWALQSVAASGGTGYEDGDTLTITVAEGDTEVSAAAATLYLDKTEPTLTLSGGATATVTMAAIGDGNYRISAVAVTSGGTGYSEGQALTFSVGVDDETVSAATATARVVHDTPENALLYEEGSGSGAVLTPAWTLLSSNLWPAPHKKTYSISSVTITNGGSGYSIDDLLEFYFASNDDGQLIEGGTIYVDAVDGSGAITAVFISNDGGRHVGSRTDALHSVQITSGGSYYHDDPGARRVFVDAGGSYYREDASEPPYVATVTVSIAQVSPSAGTGASLSVTIDDDTSSETFGEITGITIDDGGDDYLAWQWRNTKCCGDYYNGMSVVVKRLNYGNGNPCQYEHRMCGVGNLLGNVGSVQVFYNGPTTLPSVQLRSELPLNYDDASSICNTTFTASGNVSDCSDWSGVSFTAIGGATASVTTGGEYDAAFKNPGGYDACNICCQGEGDIPMEIEATFVDPAPSASADFSGTYALAYVKTTGFSFPSSNNHEWLIDVDFPEQPFGVRPAIRIAIFREPCSSQTPSSFGPYSDGPDFFLCDECHKKCRQMVVVYTGLGGIGNYQFVWNNLGEEINNAQIEPELYYRLRCELCEETPICSMAEKSWQLTSTSLSGQPPTTLTT